MLMYVGRVVFRGIVTQVFLSGLIVKFEVFLRFAVKKPEVLHLLQGGSVVYVNWHWWLWVSAFCKSETEDLGFLCIEKEGTRFGFGGGRGDEFEYRTRDGVVKAWVGHWITSLTLP
jgi:hypothetical protein